MEVTRHFTVSVYIIFQNQVLLHLHHRLKLWLPVGGHIDRDELPEEAALREAFEESGLHVNLVTQSDRHIFDQGRVRELIQPMSLMLQEIQPGHEHIDSAFVATADTDQNIPEKNKTTIDSYRWCTLEDLTKMDLRDNVRTCAERALRR